MTDLGEDSIDAHLRYLDASKVESPVGLLSQVEVETVNGEQLGDLDGVLIDPTARRIRYYVITPPRRLRQRRYLLPAEEPAQLQPDRKVLRFQIEPPVLRSCPEFRKNAVDEFSDEDLLDAMFAKTA